MGKYRSNLITAAHIYINPIPELKTVTRKDNRQKLAAADRQCTLGVVVLLPLESLLLYSMSPPNKLPVFIDVPQCDLPVGSENEYIVIAALDGISGLIHSSHTVVMSMFHLFTKYFLPMASLLQAPASGQVGLIGKATGQLIIGSEVRVLLQGLQVRPILLVLVARWGELNIIPGYLLTFASWCQFTEDFQT